MDLIDKYKILINNIFFYNKKQPFFSVIMLTFNSDYLIENSLKKIYSQTYNDFELILINDCSSDDTDNVVFKNIDDRLVYIKNNKNVGVGVSREIGINLSKGKYVVFIDVDDTIDDNLLLKLNIETVSKNPDLIIFGFEEKYINKTNKIIFTKNLLPINSYENYINNNKKYEQIDDKIEKIDNIKNLYIDDINLIKNLMIYFEDLTILGYPWNKCYKNEIIKNKNIHFEFIKIYEDIFFNINYYENIKNLLLINDTLYVYNNKINNKSVTKQKIDNYFDLSIDRIKRIYELIYKFDVLTNDSIRILKRIYIRYSYSYLLRLINNKSNKLELKKGFYKIINNKFFSILFDKKNKNFDNKFISINKIMEYAIINNKYNLSIFIANIIRLINKYCFNLYLKIAK